MYNFTAMELVSSRNIVDLVFVLKQEVTKTQNVTEHDDTGKYRQLLVRTLHACSIKVCSVKYYVFTRLHSRRVVLWYCVWLWCSFVHSFLPSYNCGYLTYFDQT